MTHAEALLLVHYQHTEIGEFHVLRQKTVGTNQNIYLSRLYLLQDFLLLLGIAETTDHLDGDRKCREALFESFIVLECQYRRWREHRHLLIVADRLERRAHRHFCLAIADISAQQPVHGLRRFHVTLHIRNSLPLIVSFTELEGVFELLHPLAVCGKRVSLR